MPTSHPEPRAKQRTVVMVTQGAE